VNSEAEAPALPVEEPGGEGRTGDRVATTVFLVVSALIAMMLAFAGLLLVMSTDSCGSTGDGNDCNTGIFTITWLLAMLIPIAGVVATSIWTSVRLKRKQTAWWAPIAGTFVFGAIYALDIVVAFWALNN
jgi:uncharacterized membrane protein HdeD (DUF308 family)